MGIKGLLPLLSPIARPVSLDRYRGLAAAVDAMAWLHRGIYAGDVRSLAHAQHAARYEEEVAGMRDGEDGRFGQQQRQQDDGDAAEAGAAEGAAEGASREGETGPSRRIDFDRALEAGPAAAGDGNGSYGGYGYCNKDGDGDGGRSKHRGRPRPAPPATAVAAATSRAAAATTARAAARPLPDPSQSAEATSAIISYVLRQSQTLLTRHGLSSLLLVLDGDSLPSKAGTNANRSEDRWRYYREAREAEERGGGSRVVRKLYAQSCGITHEMRRELVERVRGEQRRQRQRQKENVQIGDNGGGKGGGNVHVHAGTIDCLVAPYEADAQMAQLAHAGLVDVVIAEDSDLLAYGCPRVVFKVDVAGGRGEEIQLLRDLASMGARAGGGCGAGNDGRGASGRGQNGGRGRNGATTAAAAADSGGFNSSSGPSFQNWTHDMFVYMCILSGCDYCDGVPGVGIKTAHKLVRMYRTPAKIFRALRAAGRMPRPKSRPGPVGGATTSSIGFEESFWTAYRTFRHQTVYNPATGRAEPLLPIVEVASVAAPDWDAVGPPMEEEVARGIATGRIHPAQRIPWETVLAAARVTARTRDRDRDNGRANALRGHEGNERNRYPVNQSHSSSRRQLLNDINNRRSPSSTGKGGQARANSKDLFRFFARKPKESRRGSDAGVDSPRASPSSRSSRNGRPPLREIFVNTVGNDGRKGDDSLPPLATSVTNQRDKGIRGDGGGHQPIPIHFGDYSSALVGTTFQPLSRQQNNRADTSAAGGVSSRNISRAVQCLKANAAKARVIKYRGKSSPKGGKGNGVGMAGSENAHGGDMPSLRLVPGSSSQSVQSEPGDRVGVKRNDNMRAHDQVYGRSSLDAHRNYGCDHYLGAEDASNQYYSQAELLVERESVDEGAFDVKGRLLHNEQDRAYGNQSGEETCDSGYDQQFLEHAWSEGLGGDEDGAGQENLSSVDLQYQEYFLEKEALDYDCNERGTEQEAFGEDQEVGRMDPRQPPIDSAIDPDYQQFEQDQCEHFHGEGFLRSQNSHDNVDREYWQHSGAYGGAKVPGSEIAVEGSYDDTSEHLPLDVSISSPQLKRQNVNATPDFRNAGPYTFHNQDGQGGNFDHQFPLEDDDGNNIGTFGASHQYLDTTARQYDIGAHDDEDREPVVQEILQGIGTGKPHDSTLDPGVDGFSVGGDFYLE